MVARGGGWRQVVNECGWGGGGECEGNRPGGRGCRRRLEMGGGGTGEAQERWSGTGGKVEVGVGGRCGGERRGARGRECTVR